MPSNQAHNPVTRRSSSADFRSPSAKDLAYDRLVGDWDEWINRYDTGRRVETLIEDFLGPDRIRGRHCLDAGCGLGDFSAALMRHAPGRLLAVDIAPALVERLQKIYPGIETQAADLLNLAPSLGPTRPLFDVIVSSEVIEHTPSPAEAVRQLCGYLKTGGLLALSVPNRRWKWLLHLAQVLRLRQRYQGHENWVRPSELISWVQSSGLEVIRAEGIHTVPWQFLPKTWLRRLDRRLRNRNYGVALNLAVLARRKGDNARGGSGDKRGCSAHVKSGLSTSV